MQFILWLIFGSLSSKDSSVRLKTSISFCLSQTDACSHSPGHGMIYLSGHTWMVRASVWLLWFQNGPIPYLSLEAEVPLMMTQSLPHTAGSGNSGQGESPGRRNLLERSLTSGTNPSRRVSYHWDDGPHSYALSPGLYIRVPSTRPSKCSCEGHSDSRDMSIIPSI